MLSMKYLQDVLYTIVSQSLHYRHFGPDNFLLEVWGAIFCIAGCLATSLAPTHWMPVAAPLLVRTTKNVSMPCKISPQGAKPPPVWQLLLYRYICIGKYKVKAEELQEKRRLSSFMDPGVGSSVRDEGSVWKSAGYLVRLGKRVFKFLPSFPKEASADT